ncbi:hypothetical protein GGI42DRAFT_339623 [Trichoderma sp. SZMC 28013]
MRGGRVAVGHLSTSISAAIIIPTRNRSTAAPCCSPHSSVPDADTERVIRRLASAVARDAVPDPRGEELAWPLLSASLCCFLVQVTEWRVPAYSIDGTAKALGTKSPSTGFVSVLKRPGLRKEAASSGTTGVLAPVLVHDRRRRTSGKAPGCVQASQ